MSPAQTTPDPCASKDCRAHAPAVASKPPNKVSCQFYFFAVKKKNRISFLTAKFFDNQGGL
jgi:hypothetical protein